MVTLRELSIFIGLDFNKRDFKGAEERFEELKKAAESFTRVVNQAQKAFKFLGAAVGATGLAMTVMGRQSVELAKEIEQWRLRVGGTAEELSALKFAAEASGITGKKAFEAIVEAGERASDVIRNTKSFVSEAGESFKALGFKSLQELKKPNGELRDGLDLFDDLIERLAKVKVDVDRTGIAMRLFGDDVGLAFTGVNLKTLARLRKEAKALGGTISQDNIRTLRAFTIQTSILTAQLKNLRNQITFGTLPALTALARRMGKWISLNRKVIGSKIDLFTKKFSRIIRRAGANIEGYVRAFKRLSDATGFLNVAIKALTISFTLFTFRAIGAGFITGLTKAIALMKSMSIASAIMSAKLILVGIGVATLALFFEDLITHIGGGRSVFGEFLDFLRKPISASHFSIIAPLKVLLRLIEDTIETFADLVNIVTGDKLEAKIAKRAIRDRIIRRGEALGGRSDKEIETRLRLERAKDRRKDDARQAEKARGSIENRLRINAFLRQPKTRVDKLRDSLQSPPVGISKTVTQRNDINISVQGQLTPEAQLDLNTGVLNAVKSAAPEVD